jgi:hypothetical protein
MVPPSEGPARVRFGIHGFAANVRLGAFGTRACPASPNAHFHDRPIVCRVKKSRSIGIAILLLTAVFCLGFLAGVTGSRPLKKVFPTRPPAEDPHPEEFVQNFSARMTQHLDLTDDQSREVEEHLRKMAEEIRTIQRSFIPQITGALTNTIDEILPLLNEEQQAILKRQRRGIIENSPLNRVGRPPFAPPQGGGPNWGGGRPPGGQPNWQGGPPPGRGNWPEPPARPQTEARPSGDGSGD